MKKSYECISVKVFIPGLGKMQLVEIYRPPNIPLSDITQLVTETMENTNKFQFHTEFAGDSKTDIMNNSKMTRKFINMFHQYSLVNEFNLPIFISPSN